MGNLTLQEALSDSVLMLFVMPIVVLFSVFITAKYGVWRPFFVTCMIGIAVIVLSSCSYQQHRHYVTVVQPIDYMIPRYETHCFNRMGGHVPMGQVHYSRGDKCVLDRIY